MTENRINIICVRPDQKRNPRIKKSRYTIEKNSKFLKTSPTMQFSALIRFLGLKIENSKVFDLFCIHEKNAQKWYFWPLFSRGSLHISRDSSYTILIELFLLYKIDSKNTSKLPLLSELQGLQSDVFGENDHLDPSLAQQGDIQI